MKKIVIAGGSGFIGSYLSRRFRESGYPVSIVSRDVEDGWSPQGLPRQLENADVLINLAGHTINCRHTTQNKRKILYSRVDTTTALANAIHACSAPPSLWINASATAVYPSATHTPFTEECTNYADTFLSEVVQSWENAFFTPVFSDMRKVALRTSVVWGKEGGAFPLLHKMVHYGLGGHQGSGEQMVSWIHIEDYFRIILFAIQEPTLDGVVNCTAPNPVTNERLMYSMRSYMNRPFGLKAYEWMIKLGALFMGTEASLVLDSCNVIPGKLNDSKFRFKFPTIDLALPDLIREE